MRAYYKKKLGPAYDAQFNMYHRPHFMATVEQQDELLVCAHLLRLKTVNFNAERTVFFQNVWKLAVFRFPDAVLGTTASHRSGAWKKFLLSALLPVWFGFPTELPDLWALPGASYITAYPFLFEPTRGMLSAIVRGHSTSHIQKAMRPEQSKCDTRLLITSLERGYQDALVEEIWDQCFPAEVLQQ